MGKPVLSAPGPKPPQPVEVPVDVPVNVPLPSPPVMGDGASGGPPVADSVDPGAISAALERLRADGSYQFDLSPPPPPVQPPAWLRDFLEAIGPFFNALGPVFTGVFWLAVAALIIFLLYTLVPAVKDWVDSLIGRRRIKAADGPDHPDWHPSMEAARNLLAEADALAAAGRYGDAVRLLLGRSLEDIAVRRPGLLKPAMTARAIAIEPALPPPARSAFAEMAATVERALFALRVISADEWQTTRAAYGRFALRDQWAGESA